MNIEAVDRLFPEEPEKRQVFSMTTSTDFHAAERHHMKEMLHQKTFQRYRYDPLFMAKIAKRRKKNKAAKQARKKNRKS